MTADFKFRPPDFTGKTILVTGGTGSFGRCFVDTVTARWALRKCIVFSRDEEKQWQMQQELRGPQYACMRYFIGDVRDADRLELAMRGVDVVIHAAALKHVPAAEYNPFECVQTNVIGAQNVVRAALRCGVRQVLALSTDKAANPVNLYGATKLAADKIFIASGNLAGEGGTAFAVVRYGNVLGSRGSVVPLFRRLLAQGADHLPITDPRMTRFWITLPQGVDFVLSCLGLMEGGEIFVPKIPSMRLIDLAETIAPGLPHRIVGIRPGEKLHEVMIPEDDAANTYELPDRYVIGTRFTSWTPASLLARGAARVADGFRYASDSNPDWLTREGLGRLLAGLP